ncbi:MULTISPECIES: aldo/keto reductase family oxidoreductase [Microbacterium]|uniref:aldo/keto reductase n=1 Tax=Microbacterium TaxID=33882 RepID=UPI0027823A07|nr:MULTISPECIES: aldo/keto reductase [Microbacterium]MDQ1082995.1 putative oxidoreductase [Microbacterium sp. SORGH_AS_0344]MDQ1168238.1 putative oxidoreductase [Microbacterium proteolyticum]
MRNVPLGSSGLTVPNVVAGMMRIDDMSDADVRSLYEAARHAGIDFFDHADIYARSLHSAERRFAEALGLSASERGEIRLQTKAGIVREGPYFDFSYEHLVSSVEESLRALHTDYIDVLLLHRPDALVEPAEVARAFDHLESTGKVRAFGVSNHTPRQIDLLRTAVRQPLVANQVQLSIAHAPILTQGLAANMESAAQSAVLDGGGLVEYCRIAGITLQAWSPLQGTRGGGTFLANPEYPELNAVIDELAQKYDVPPLAIAVAWITRHPADMQVVLGTTNPGRLTDAAVGSDLRLTRAEWYALVRAAGYLVP